MSNLRITLPDGQQREVQMLAGRGTRCRIPGQGGFTRCPDNLRELLLAQHGQEVVDTLDSNHEEAELRNLERDGERQEDYQPPALQTYVARDGKTYYLQNLPSRGVRCRDSETRKFVKCQEEVSSSSWDQLMARNAADRPTPRNCNPDSCQDY